MAELLGATPVLVQAADIPQAFATGIVNAMMTSAQTGVDSAAWDYSRYFYNIGFTLTRNVVVANTRALRSLDAPTQAAITGRGRPRHDPRLGGLRGLGAGDDRQAAGAGHADAGSRARR